MRYIGIDPGGTTGICIKIGDSFTREQWPTTTPAEYLELFHRLGKAAVGDNVTVVMERFNFRMNERDRTKIDYTPAEVIGVVKFWVAAHGLAKLEMQMAAEGKAFWSDEKLRTIGLYLPSLPHAMDATRHVLQYISFTDPRDYTYINKLSRHVHDERRLEQVRRWDKT